MKTEMTPEVQKKFNKYYWQNIAQPAMARILKICKAENRHLDIEATPDDFFRAIKYLEDWSKNKTISSEIKRDLEVIRNFKGYEDLIAA